MKMQGFYKGVNLGGWLSQCTYSEQHMDEFITEPDFVQIRDWGFDHVRIPFDYNILECEDGSWNESGFARLKNALALARKYGMNAVLDLHKAAGFSFDTYSENESGFFDRADYQERFYVLWEELAKRFGDDPEHVAFELLNEVTNREFIEPWKRIADTCIRRIRKFAPKTQILIGSYFNNAVAAVPALDPPQDEFVIYNFHCYEPLKFTHQGAYWTDQINPSERMAFEQSGTSVEYFEQLFEAAIQHAEANGTSLYCGEYGVIEFVKPEDAVKWFKAINTVLQRHRIGRAVWCYKAMNFGLTNPALDDVRAELLQYL